MGSYDIGISGFNAAQRALDIIGNNIANAATEGYHRQEIDLKSKNEVLIGGFPVGQGVNFDRVVRVIDHLLDNEIVNQESSFSQISKELDTLKVMENAFGELSTSGLSRAMDNFYDTLHYLSNDPNDANLQHAVITSAESMTYQFRSLGTVLNGVQDSIYADAVKTVESINLIASQISELNGEVSSAIARGMDPVNTLDHRDQLVTQLSRLTGVTVFKRENESIDISLGNFSLVSGSTYTNMQLNLVGNGDAIDFSLSPAGSTVTMSSVSGGKLGGLFSLRNDIIKDVQSQLDTIASTMMTDINKIHTQAVGSSGSFTTLTGQIMPDALSDFSPALGGTAAEEVRVRVTHSDLTVTNHIINIDASATTADTMTSIAAQFDAIADISSSIDSSGKMVITATNGAQFDFLPVSPVTDSDTIGFLAVVGLNTFFSGTNAETMTITNFISGSGGIGRVASSGTTSMEDNEAILEMAKYGDVINSGLGGYTPKGYYRQIATSLGSTISASQLKYDNTNSILRSLNQRRDEISGVDMNNEASKMLLFERMFQGMAKYINVVTRTIDTVMTIVR